MRIQDTVVYLFATFIVISGVISLVALVVAMRAMGRGSRDYELTAGADRRPQRRR
jgi:hypothetical protein